MFGKQRVTQKTWREGPQEEPVVMSNVAVVKASAYRDDAANHLIRRCLSQWRPSLDIEKVAALSHMIMTAEKAATFKYAALYSAVDSRVNDTRTILRDNHWGQPVYSGDAPDFILDRVSRARAAGLGIFTIHSNRPLPVTYQQKADPVLLAWLINPEFHYSGADTWHSSQPSSIGIVLGVWDNDKELETV